MSLRDHRQSVYAFQQFIKPVMDPQPTVWDRVLAWLGL